MPKGDINLPAESGWTDLRRDTEVSTGNSKSPTKTVYYRDSLIPARKAGEPQADFSKREQEFRVADKRLARILDRRQVTKNRSMRGGKR